MRAKAARGLLALGLLTSGSASAQSRPPPTRTAEDGFRAHVGVGAATRLLRSPDPADRLRALERLAALRTPEAVVLLERAVGAAVAASDAHGPADGVARTDPRALLVTVRGLADASGDEKAIEALLDVVRVSSQLVALRVSGASTPDPAADEALALGRVELARHEAALAVAASGTSRAATELLSIARSGGPGERAAVDALALHPPSAPLLGGVTLTTPVTIGLAASTGDLRAADAVRGVLVVSDAAVRAAALDAAGETGDARVLEVVRASVHDKDPRVRIAAARALGRLGDPAAGPAVEALIGDPLTVTGGLRIAQEVQGSGVVRAAAALAAAASDPRSRSAALEALGRQVDPLAVSALATLALDAFVGGDAACALARSPSPAALGAIEVLAGAPATRRLAARAYFVRRAVRGQRSERLDALLAELARASDPIDRAVGVGARVALGEVSLTRALGDPDVGVRRAAAMGALRSGVRGPVPPEALADAPTRQVLAFARGEIEEEATTPDLIARAEGAGPEGPLAAEALARRAGDDVKAKLAGLLASRDPLLRAAAARGLGASPEPDAVGRLAAAYLFEPDALVRRALVWALATRAEVGAPSRREALHVASRLDPEGSVRVAAARAEAGQPPLVAEDAEEVAWLRVVAAEGAPLPQAMTGTLVGADGRPRPVVFSADGYALVPGLPPGEAQLRLAPRLRADEAR